MLGKNAILAGYLCVLLTFVAVKSFAAAPMDAITLGYSSFSGPCGLLWVAFEDQLGNKVVPMPSLDVIESALDILSHQYPQAKPTDPLPVIDSSVLRRIEQSGFIRAIYKR